MSEKHPNTTRAVSVHYGHALAILRGEKTVEYRSFKIATGDLVICTTARDSSGSYADYGYAAPTSADLGAALCLVTVTSVDSDGWTLANVRPLQRVPVKGALGIWRLANDKIRLLSGEASPAVTSAPKTAIARPIASPVATRPTTPAKTPTRDNSAQEIAALIARCRSVASLVEAENLVAAMRRRVVEAYRVVGAATGNGA